MARHSSVSQRCDVFGFHPSCRVGVHMKWLKQKLASLMNRIAPLDESIDEGPRCPVCDYHDRLNMDSAWCVHAPPIHDCPYQAPKGDRGTEASQ